MSMIGSVTEALEAMLRIEVHDSNSHVHEVEAIIDTGFNGYLTLSSKLIAALGLPWLFRQQGQLADDSIQVFDVYKATVVWDSVQRVIEVEAVDAHPLIGMGLLEDYCLTVDVRKGGKVSIQSLP
jgi:clan AA aspartic protease